MSESASRRSASGTEGNQDPVAAVAAVEKLSTVHKTSCGSGEMVWHRWGNGPPLLLLHGGAGSWSHWLSNVESLSHSLTVWAPDMPGFGDSALPPKQSIDSFLETIEQGWAVLNPGSGPVDVMGFSLGGAIAVVIAGRLQDRLANLVLAGPRFTSFSGGDLPLISWRKLEDPAQRVAAHRHNVETMMLANPAHIDATAVHLQSINAERMRVTIRKWKPGARDRQHEYFPQIKPRGSITVIFGCEDQGAKSIIANNGAELKAVHPDLRLHFIEGAGHWVQYEAAERFNAIALGALSHTT